MTIRRSKRGRINVRAAVVAEALERRDLLATFTVVTTGDTGAGSLRQAILSANANPGADTIGFNISGGGLRRISVSSGLPRITDTLTVDGGTQPGYAGTPLIEVVGPVSDFSTGFDVTADGCVIRGLAIDGFWHRVELWSSRNVVAGNYIGITATGDEIISPAHPGTGVTSWGDDNTIGGTIAAARNVISGNELGVRPNGKRNVIAGNYIGTDPSGTRVIGNTIAGVLVGGEQTVVGGTVAEARNVISGNAIGIDFDSGSVNSAVIQGNYIGTDVTGTKALPNGRGVFIDGIKTTLGGDAAGAGNVISGNAGDGVQVSNESFGGHRVLGNLIGLAADGVTPLGNGGYGISVPAGSLQIGGRAKGEGNRISANVKGGVSITALANGVTVVGNSIFANGGPPIDLAANGPTPNDPLDADTGPNGLQNFPVLTKPSRLPGGTRVTGVLPSAPGGTYTIDFYEDYPGGQAYLGSTTVVTDAAGNATFDVTLPNVGEPGDTISATATSSAGATSEFSARVYIPLPGDADHNGVVNFDDLLVLAKNYNGAPRTWETGDFTGDGVVNFDDLLILAKNYNRTAAAAPPVAMAPVASVTASAVAAPTRPATKEKDKPVFAAKPVVKPAPPAKPVPVRRKV